MARPLDDLVAIAEALLRTEGAVLVPERRDAILQLVELLRQRRLVAVGKQVPELGSPLGRGFELGVDFIECSHAS